MQKRKRGDYLVENQLREENRGESQELRCDPYLRSEVVPQNSYQKTSVHPTPFSFFNKDQSVGKLTNALT
jgi:hypothetical protein